MGAVGQNANLAACIGHGRHTDLDQRHRQQSNSHLLPCRHHHVQLAGHRLLADLLSQINEPIGLPTHGRDHYDNIVAFLAEFFDLRRYLLDALDGANRGTSKLLYDQSHLIAA